MTPRPQIKRKSGQSTVEFALCLVIFLAIVLLLIDLSVFYFVQSTLSHAVRTGLRAAVVGAHHRDLAVGQTPRAKLISIVQGAAAAGGGLTKLQAGVSTEGSTDTLKFSPVDAFNSNENMTITATRTHRFITPIGRVMHMMGAANTQSNDWVITVSVRYRSEIFEEAN